MARRLVIVLSLAGGLAAADLVVNAFVPTDAWDFHQRSPAWSIVALVLLGALLAVGLLPSLVVSLAAGIAAGGVAGNILSARLHDGRVPNPLVVGPVAFNLADVLVVCAAPVLTIALAHVAIRHRSFIDRHIPPRRWEVALRRRVGL
jgi:hypothetical protein